MVNRQDKLLVNDAMQFPFKVLLPGQGHDAARLALLEGPIFLKRLWNTPDGPLGLLGGYGAPLELRPPYNFGGFKMVVAAEVHVIRAYIDRHLGSRDNATVRIYLRHRY